VAASLELFQAAALIHDDVMDGSDTRRGHAAVHRRFAAHAPRQRLARVAESFGVAGASWPATCACPGATRCTPVRRCRRGCWPRRAVFDRMRTELMCGQYLDMLEQVRATTSVEQARHVIRYKSANYTVAQPLLLGGRWRCAGELLAAYDDYGLALGEAFQLRDDVLGSSATRRHRQAGGDDLREGKRTVLVARRWRRRSPAQAAELRRSLGDPQLGADGVERLRDVMRRDGALATVERLIASLCDSALATLAAAESSPSARRARAARGRGHDRDQ
jgi:geranylgeranyl diphosphate synthase type I